MLLQNTLIHEYTAYCAYQVLYQDMELDNTLAVIAASVIAAVVIVASAIALVLKHSFSKGGSFELNIQLKRKSADS